MTNKDLADLILPNITKTIDDYEKMYPERNLKEGARVTRFAPSPTGFIHIGGIMQATIDYTIAKHTGGVFMLRIEDTDKSRELEGATDIIMHTIRHYGLNPDEYEENGVCTGEYGPYVQSERKEIYQTFVKHLIEIGRAYPCFCTKEELEATHELQTKNKIRTGYHGRYARCRKLTIEEAAKRIKNGEPYVIRFKSMGDFDKKFVFEDLVKGKVELPENDMDVPIMKSNDGLPTYHFAHLVDDHLMRTTHVIRGEEWLPSVPLHIELFKTFGFKAPKYIHTPLIMKKDGDSIRKISKRKDPEALMEYYEKLGYPKEAVVESVMTIINSNFEEWRTGHPDAPVTDFEFSPKKMSSSGAFYDLGKLDNLSKNAISRFSARRVYDELLEWSKKYDEDFSKLLIKYEDYAISTLNIEREQKKPRKDFANYSEIKGKIWYMFDELWEVSDKEYDFQSITDKNEIKNIVTKYFDEYYSDTDDKETWFNKIKELSSALGYAPEVKEYKANPDAYKGHVGDVSTVLRVAVTKESMTPDLYEIMKLLGSERMKNRSENLK
jgi:glutamyl-tRNA synthetase